MTDGIEASSLCSSLAVQRWPRHPTSLILGFLTHNTAFRYLVTWGFRTVTRGTVPTRHQALLESWCGRS